MSTKEANITTYHLGELFLERKEQGFDGLEIFSVTRKDGLVPRDSLGRKVDSELAAHQHLLVRKGDIAYNMMRMWQGVSGFVERDGLVSPSYVVLQPTEKVDSRYASYLFKLPEMIQLFRRFSQGLTDDRLRLYYEQFRDIKVSIPRSVDNQRKIAEVLTSLDQQISDLKNKADRLAQLKSAISQDLLIHQ